MENSTTDGAADRVSLDQVLRVAELAQLELTAAEQTEMLRDLNSILGHVAELQGLDTAGVPAMTQVSEIFAGEMSHEGGSARDESSSALRADMARPSLDRREVMAAAPDTDGTYFKVPKVIER